MLFLYRLLKNIISFIIIQLPLMIVGAIMLAIYLPIHFYLYNHKVIKTINLPWFVKWFDCVDLYTNRDTSSYIKVFQSGLIPTYIFLALRNPCNYFNYIYLGFMFTGREIYKFDGTDNYLDIGDSTNCVPGYKHIELIGDNQGKYEYLYVKKIGVSHCFYFRMGYKIKDTNNPMNTYCEAVFTISYRQYSGL